MSYKIGPGQEDKRIGETIRALRKKSGLTATELGRAIDRSEQLIRAVENGTRKATPKVCRAVADALGVPLAAITMRNYAQIRDTEDSDAA